MGLSFTVYSTKKLTLFDENKIQQIDSKSELSVVYFTDGTYDFIVENSSEIESCLKKYDTECFIKLTKCWDLKSVFCNVKYISGFKQREDYTFVELRDGEYYLVKEPAEASEKLCNTIYSKYRANHIM